MTETLALLVQYGSRRGGFSSDVLQGSLCADAREAGHTASLFHVYWEGEPAGDAVVRERLSGLVAGATVIVVERALDASVLGDLRRACPSAQVVLVARTEGFSRLDGVDWVLVEDAHTVTPGLRAHPLDELRRAFGLWLEASPEARAQVPGMARVRGDEVTAPALALSTLRSRDRLPFRPALDPVDVSTGGPLPRHHHTVYGNSGCPYARDVEEEPSFRGLPVLAEPTVARRGCSFCHMGGDYERRPEAELLVDLVAQAGYLTRGLPELDSLVLSDQNPQRYLERLLLACDAAGLRPLRWLFQTRADAFLRDLSHIEAAVRTAARLGAILELYLVGFESFCDEELRRYNKGVTAEEQIRAVQAMRALRRRSRGAFSFTEARGHSLILFNPWTRPEHLAETADRLRAHGLGELFRDLGWNRLRLYPNLPILHAAERDGLVTDQFEGERLGRTTRDKGYSVDVAWRFQDPRTLVAYELVSALRERLGRDAEIAQLRAIAAFARTAEGAPGGVVRRVLEGIDALDEALRAVPGGPAEPRAAVVRLTGGCNNGCAGCANRDHHLDDDDEAVLAGVVAARREGGPIVLAGREPTLRRDFVSLVEAARGADLRRVGVVTNGRRFAYPAFASAARRAGLAGASVKLFGAEPETSDAYVRAPGAHAQTLAGLAHLFRLGVSREVRAMLHGGMLAETEALVALAARQGVRTIRLEVPLDALGLDRLDAAAEAVGRMGDEARRRGVVLRSTRVGVASPWGVSV